MLGDVGTESGHCFRINPVPFAHQFVQGVRQERNIGKNDDVGEQMIVFGVTTFFPAKIPAKAWLADCLNISSPCKEALSGHFVGENGRAYCFLCCSATGLLASFSPVPERTGAEAWILAGKNVVTPIYAVLILRLGFYGEETDRAKQYSSLRTSNAILSWEIIEEAYKRLNVERCRRRHTSSGRFSLDIKAAIRNPRSE